MRDNFSAKTKRALADRVGYRCSNPDCRKLTIGPSMVDGKSSSIGKASHITAASLGFKRYDSSLTPEERASFQNGIWTCENCGKLIDTDETRYTVDLLRKWKKNAESVAFSSVATSGISFDYHRINAQLVDNEDLEYLHGLNLPKEDDVDTVAGRMRTAAANDINAYRSARDWPQYVIPLNLILHSGEGSQAVSLDAIAQAMVVAENVNLLSPPGTGKSTTLVQLADRILEIGEAIPALVPLGEWSDRTETFFQFLARRNGFRTFRPEHFMQMAYQGRLVLLLDGWNELDPVSQVRAMRDLRSLQREFPQLSVIVGSRKGALPVLGVVLEIELLSEEQQLELARAIRGEEGGAIVDQAWRTQGVRELIAIPLYLHALLKIDSSAVFPKTKEEILRMFVMQHETDPEKAAVLQRELLGVHAKMLVGIAVEANRSANTVVSDSNARRALSGVSTQLIQDGQLTIPLQPGPVIDALVGNHILIRSSAGSGGVSFQHQQFQEWYGSFEVERLMQERASGDAAARVALRINILNEVSWEESILFACERLSRRDTSGVQAVAATILEANTIDPMLAAEIIYRSAPAVWEIVKADIIAFVDRWHRPGTVDRAVRFMIMTGRSDFASRIWPLASNANSQIQLPTLRIAPRFRPSVLGPDIRSKIVALPEETREHLLALIASESGMDGMDLATEIAKTDISPKVQVEVIQYLQFRRADRHVATLLANARDETWALLATHGYADEILDISATARLQEERVKSLTQATEPLERLRQLINRSSDYPDRDAGIAAAIADERFPIRDQHSGTTLHYAQEQAPTAVLMGIRQRLEAGLELPFGASKFLRQLEVTDEDPIATAILDVSGHKRHAEEIASMAGPKTVDALVNRYLVCVTALRTARNNSAMGDEYRRLQSRLGVTRTPLFLAAIMARANSVDPEVISSLASLINTHGNWEGRNATISFDPTTKEQLISMLQSWVKVVISSPDGERYQLNEISNAISRFGFRELLPELKRLLDEDLMRLKKARDGFLDAQKRGDIRATSDAGMRYSNQYRGALSRIGGDEVAAIAVSYLEDREFGFDASLILKAISDMQLDQPEPEVRRTWPQFDEVAAARIRRATSSNSKPANQIATAIFAAIDRLAKPETDSEGQQLAIQLAAIALAMPHSNQDDLISRVVALPQPLTAKRVLLTAIALDGQVLDVDVIMKVVDEWLAEASSKGDAHAWHKRQNTWEIEPWLELLPFTNSPEAVVEGLTKVKAFYGTPWAKRWERVLKAVTRLPGAEGEVILANLARNHKDIADDYQWMKAILGRNSSSGVLLFVDLFIDGVFGKEPREASPWHVGRELAKYIQKFPNLKAELKKRYENISSNPGRAMLEHFFSQAGDENDLVAMIKKYVASGQAYDGLLDAVVRAVALREVPVSDDSNVVHIHPASMAQTRKFLFGLLRGTEKVASLAKNCLIAIDILRDEHGIVADDTRHPDVKSETPWPIEAGMT